MDDKILRFVLRILRRFSFTDDTMNSNTVRELKLHSPAGVEPAVFTWPNDEQQVRCLSEVFFDVNYFFRKRKKMLSSSVAMRSFELFA